jgi:site-specific recombinase XerD
MNKPAGETLEALRDRAMIKFFLYSGARLATGSRLKAEHFHQDGEEYTIRINEKGNKRRTIGLNFVAGQAIAEYIEHAGITSGPLFRPKINSRSKKLANRHMTPTSMYLILMSYLQKLPGALKEYEDEEGVVRLRCIYTPHSLRATTATLLLDAGVDIRKVQKLLGHRHVTTTQIYAKRRVNTSESASHEVPI